MNFQSLLITALALATTATASAKIKTETVAYKQGDTELEGYLAYDDNKKQKPGVVVIHDWMGVTDDTKMRVEQLAKQGYAAFAADIYGKGVRPKSGEEAGAQAGKFKKDRALMRARAQAAYDFLAAKPFVKKDKMAAMGFCFGGTTALEMGRAGLNLAAIASFHGGLDNPKPEDTKNIKAKVLVLHGAIDPFVSKKELDQFMKEMNDAKIDYQFISYSGAVHAFTVKAAGNDISKGAAYDEKAERRSFVALKDFFTETL